VTSILFICHGNICRSTMAQFVFEHLARERGAGERFYVDSAATSREEIGNGVHRGTQKKLAEMGIACGSHRARQMTRADYDAFDLIVGMDDENLDGIYRILSGESGYGWGWRPFDRNEVAKADPEGKVHLLLDWSARPRDIADPWYSGNFDATFDDVLEGCSTLLDALLA
jgi:protein-tyrosine phosphatase